MKTILIILLFSIKSFSQDSLTARVIKTGEKVVIYKVNKMRFVSFDCGCGLRKGMEFKIERKKFDSLVKQAKPIRKRDI